MLFGSLTHNLNPKTLAIPSLFSVSIVWPPQECEVKGIGKYVGLSIWIPQRKEHIGDFWMCNVHLCHLSMVTWVDWFIITCDIEGLHSPQRVYV